MFILVVPAWKQNMLSTIEFRILTYQYKYAATEHLSSGQQ
jgi:hypothetical protein